MNKLDTETADRIASLINTFHVAHAMLSDTRYPAHWMREMHTAVVALSDEFGINIPGVYSSRAYLECDRARVALAARVLPA